MKHRCDNTKRCCDNCHWWSDDVEVCCNDKSEYCGDFTLESDCCECWEEKKK